MAKEFCHRCISLAVVMCIKCGAICCLMCDLSEGAETCACGHNEQFHGSIEISEG